MNGKERLSPWPVVACAIAYGMAGAIALALDAPAKGWAILFCSLAGVVGVCLLARSTGRRRWSEALCVLVPVSVFQVLPDWFLARHLESIWFPDNGGPRVDHLIPLAMAGLWVLPLLIVVLLARGSLWRGALISTLVFLATELLAPHIGVWQPRGELRELAGAALYVVPAEALLGSAAVYAVRIAGPAGWGTRIVAAFAVSTFYTGALALSFMLVELG